MAKKSVETPAGETPETTEVAGELFGVSLRERGATVVADTRFEPRVVTRLGERALQADIDEKALDLRIFASEADAAALVKQLREPKVS
jgi:hypothetical protein